MNRKIIALIMTITIIFSFLFYILSNNILQNTVEKTPTPKETIKPQQEVTTYDEIKIQQSQIHLNHEAVQYQIFFHDNDTILYDISIILPQVDFNPKACLITLTDGNESLFENSTMIFVSNVPTGSIMEISILKHRITIGGKLLDKLFALTPIHLGSAGHTSDYKNVKKGESWFLTIANLNDNVPQTVNVTFESGNKSMEITEVDRTDNMGFLIGYNNDFDGRYIGFKIPFTPMGFSIAKLHKEITTKKGMIMYFISVGHIIGKMNVEFPTGEKYTDKKIMFSSVSYCGNQTGTWRFSTSGVGFFWEHFVSLFYVDINPHLHSL